LHDTLLPLVNLNLSFLRIFLFFLFLLIHLSRLSTRLLSSCFYKPIRKSFSTGCIIIWYIDSKWK